MNKLNKLLSEYVELESQFKVIEENKLNLRAMILGELMIQKMDKVEDPLLGTFSVAHKVSWEYSPKVKTMEEKVKIAKVQEQEKGIATPKESSYLLYNKPKAGSI